MSDWIFDNLPWLLVVFGCLIVCGLAVASNQEGSNKLRVLCSVITPNENISAYEIINLCHPERCNHNANFIYLHGRK